MCTAVNNQAWMDAGGARYAKNARAVSASYTLWSGVRSIGKALTSAVETRLVELILQSAALRDMKVHTL
jgi:hypothetical protein